MLKKPEFFETFPGCRVPCRKAKGPCSHLRTAQPLAQPVRVTVPLPVTDPVTCTVLLVRVA